MKRTHIIIFALLTITAQYSCKKQLDAPPKDALVEGNTIINQQTANIALNGVYFRFANADQTKTDWSTNQVNPGILTGVLDDGHNSLSEARNVLGKTNFNSDWGRYYTLVNAANGVIDQVTILPDNLFSNGRKEQILAEARCLRAFGTFKVLLFMGQWFDINSAYGALLQNKFITSTTYARARSSVKDSYQFILEDLDYAIANAAATGSNVYITRWAAMALKMRVLLSRGQQADYTGCAALGDSIINSGNYVLEPNARDIFYVKGLTSKEVILGVTPQAAQGNYYYNTSGLYVRRSSFYVATRALDSILQNDPRRSWYIGQPNADKANTFYFIKYVQPGLATTQLSEVSYAIRLAEVYLMAAEATVRAGGNLASARTLIHAVQAGAGITATDNGTNYLAVEQALTADALLRETYVEYIRSFAGEDDQYYFALLRFPLATVTSLRPTITTKEQYIYPIPHSEFTSNPLIGAQNPGYTQ
ncbi:RagB/SusD family nutrient uptake outer membrane protein [Chitinophaga agrisoli]|uniref:RagB/SusD family nutrient uptake outer membrane protein n=1 Tax=Chitinophaga agrisoli TaxID=2607653 RepID=A0A5B2W2X1_9BACT|nr:RagB/SusD family nutrient uptake outer membrane protein [Chitinophaga agrisoli]KAA2245218.1 RagB/SusD family nutrient uptake outer membrane protein [Chitinophaga agrisoli]